MKRLCCLALTCVTLASTAALNAGEPENRSFDITLHRPVAIGHKMRVRGEGILDRTVTAVVRGAEQSPQKSIVKITFDADSEVLRVDDKGRPVRVAHTVRECVARQDNIASVIATPGSTLIASRRGSTTTFEIDGRPVGPAADEALQMLASLDAGEVTEDDIAGTNQPRSIGDSWPINTNATAQEMLRQSGQRVRPSDFSGSTTLVDVTEHLGEECLALYTQMFTANTVPGLRDIPTGFTVSAGSMTASAHRLYPVDENLPRLSDFRHTAISATLTGQGGAGQPLSTVQFKMVQMVEIETTPLAPRTVRASTERATQATQD